MPMALSGKRSHCKSTRQELLWHRCINRLSINGRMYKAECTWPQGMITAKGERNINDDHWCLKNIALKWRIIE